MNNAHINWCQLINFHLTALYLFFFPIRAWLLGFVLQNSLRGLLLEIIPEPSFDPRLDFGLVSDKILNCPKFLPRVQLSASI